MSYYSEPPPPREPDGSIKFLGMSGGILLLTIAMTIIAPFLLCFLCLGVGLVGSVIDPPATPTP